VPVLAVGGTVLLAGGAAVLTGVAHGPDALVVVGSGLIGLGVGASVSTALFVTGFSLRLSRNSHRRPLTALRSRDQASLCWSVSPSGESSSDGAPGTRSAAGLSEPPSAPGSPG
jgi:hypothetical protein